MTTHWPAGAAESLQALQAHAIGENFDEGLATILRIAASVRSNSICLCSGPATLPYVDWIRDGMPMTGRLIIQLDPREEGLDSIVQSQLDADIRVAGHYQAIAKFCRDIAQHRLDLVLLDLDDDVTDVLPALLELLNENALVVLVSTEERLRKASATFSTEYFTAPVGHSGAAVALARKGMQHRQKRRSGRRRRRG